jgi:hypothetical protein
VKNALVFAAALALAGCGGKKDKQDDKAPPPAGSAVAMAGNGSAGSAAMAGSGSATTAMAGSGSAVDVPTEEDFESQAKTDITTANVDTKVKAIEDQLGQQ